MAVTNGKGGSLDFGTFRTGFREAQHGDARWLNGVPALTESPSWRSVT